MYVYNTSIVLLLRTFNLDALIKHVQMHFYSLFIQCCVKLCATFFLFVCMFVTFKLLS